MGKQAKKKQKTDAQASKQRRHNRNTRGINTKKKGALWAIRSFKTKEDGVEVTKTYEVRVPPGTLYNPFDRGRYSEHAQEPFDALQLEWREELMHYAAENDAKIGSIDLGNGQYLHRVYYGDTVKNPDSVLLEIQSARKFLVEKRGPRRRARRKKA
jgi:hypothetical protein